MEGEGSESRQRYRLEDELGEGWIEAINDAGEAEDGRRRVRNGRGMLGYGWWG
jgi:hypothetical protein